MDFADFRLPWGKRHALIVVLGYSRLMWLRYFERQTMPVVMRGLEVGVPVLRGRPVGAAVRDRHALESLIGMRPESAA